MEYLNFHETSLEADKIIINVLFGIKKNIKIGVQQVPNSIRRSSKNPNQIIVDEKPYILANEYNVFKDGREAYEVLKDFIFQELKIDDFDLKSFTTKDQNKNLYFFVFEHIVDETPKFRGVFYATTKTHKPSFWVALVKNLEYEYDHEIYRK